LPKLALYNPISAKSAPRVKKEYRLFIGACGSDRRAYQGLSILAKKARIHSALLFEYEERTASIKGGRGRRQYRRYEKLIPGAGLLSCSVSDRNCAMRSVTESVSVLDPSDSVVVDISVFTKPYLFALLRSLQIIGKLSRVQVLYTEPSFYLKDRSNRWAFTKRPYEVFELPGYAGRSDESAQRLLVMLLGFDGGEAHWVYEDQAPTVTVPINGFPSYLLYYKDVSLMENSFLFEEQRTKSLLEYAPANDPFGTFNALDRIRRKHPRGQYTMTITPLGTKPMALGSALFALYNDDVRVVYPMPSRYGLKVSQEVGKTWLYDIPLQP
jgi:hypothetical protein